MRCNLSGLLAVVASGLVCLPVFAADGTPSSGGIYICVDAKGRRLTSDRPIPECSDREQRVLNPSGTTRERIGPTLTAKEQAQLDAQKRAEQEAASRQAEERRRDKALLSRYPNKAAHDKQRQESLESVNSVIVVVKSRIESLIGQRNKITIEAKAFGSEPAKWPNGLRQRYAAASQNLESQEKFLADQEQERQRINDRFDEELSRLEDMWAQRSTVEKR